MKILKTTAFSYIASGIIIVGVLFCSCTKNVTEQLLPTASFNYTSARIVPVTVKFSNLSLPNPVGVDTYLWDFGDGQTAVAPDTVIHSYPFLGIYQVNLVQISSGGVRDTASIVLNLNNLTGPSGNSSRQLSAAFSYIIRNAFTTTFTNNSTEASGYFWDFGDGTTSTSSNITIIKNYPAPATFLVRLTAIGPNSADTCSATITFN